MSQIMYSGVLPKFSQFTPASGTQAELVDAIKDFLTLTTGGWTTVSGAAGDWVVQSGLTSQGYQHRLRIYSAGAVNCAKIIFRNSSEVLSSGDFFLLAGAAGKVWNFWSNGYMFFAWVNGSILTREFFCCGMPWCESFQVASFPGPNVAFAHSNSTSDTDVTVRHSWRQRLCMGAASGNAGGAALLVAATLTNNSNGAGNNGMGLPSIFGPSAPFSPTGIAQSFRFANGNYWLDAAWVGFDPTATLFALSENRVFGRLYDAHMSGTPVAAETTKAYDGRNWRAVTVNNTGSNSPFMTGGTLWLYTP